MYTLILVYYKSYIQNCQNNQYPYIYHSILCNARIVLYSIISMYEKNETGWSKPCKAGAGNTLLVTQIDRFEVGQNGG